MIALILHTAGLGSLIATLLVAGLVIYSVHIDPSFAPEKK